MMIFFITLFFSACEVSSIFGPSKNELEMKNKELETKLEYQKSELQNKKELELAKLDSEIKNREIDLKKEEIASKNLSAQANQETTKLIILAIVVVILVIAAGLFFYFNNRRKDKLRAYEDNLEKYFRQKDREAKLQIANKIIDTIASGKLTKEQENRLLVAISDKPLPQNEIENFIANEEIEDEPLKLDFKESNDSSEESTDDEKKKKKKKKKKLED